MLIGIVVFLLVLIALLAVPVTLIYRVSWRQAFKGKITLQWLFGLIRIQLPIAEGKGSARKGRTGPREKRKKVSSAKKSNPMAAFRQKSFRQRIFRFLRDVWQAVHKHQVELRIRIGLGDPADTGLLWSVVGPVSGMLATVQDASVDIEPEFIDVVFELDSSGNIRVIPLQMIYLIVALLLSPALWHGIRQMRDAGK